ncbi:MAG: RraA family protein, partial [Anaerolineae bacterium]|nr:RraA family protein [Anaerolineae bacterium]
MPGQMTVEEMGARYQRVATATVFDTLEELGYSYQCLAPDIRPLTLTMRIAGPAVTLKGARDPRGELKEPLPKFRDYGMHRAFYPGCVVVIDTEKAEGVGCWGDLMSYSAHQRGAVGLVCDGGVRDALAMLEIPRWSVFTRFVTPTSSYHRFKMHDFQIPVSLSGALSHQVAVHPGDWLVGDADG